LLRVSSGGRGHFIDAAQASLYGIAVREWRGFVYVNLGGGQGVLADNFNANHDSFDHWPLENLAVGRRLTKHIHCNWKVFWDNYNECVHCPTVHPALASLVPIYKRGIMEPRDDPNWRTMAASKDPAFAGGLRNGASTWSIDGKIVGREFPNLTQEERRIGYHYMTSLPSHYLVLHADHVRSTRLLPLGPEHTQLEIEWLFAPETLADPAIDIAGACDFSAQVMAEDGTVCELAQRGMHAAPHARGFLLPEEYDVYRFQQWVRDALAGAPSG
jgi:Rieske 2Fe-2S family protein